MWKPGVSKITTMASIFEFMAGVFELAGAGNSALRSLEKAIKVNPHKIDLHLKASRLYLKFGQLDRAALHCKKATSGMGSGSFIYWLQRSVNGGLKTNHWDQVKYEDLEFEVVSNQDMCSTDKVSEFNDCGLCLLENGKYREALTCFQQAIALGGNHPAVLLNAGLALSKLNRHKEALEYYIHCQSLGLCNAELLNNKGYSLFYLGNYEEALSCYEVARQFMPNDIGLLSNMASCYHSLGKVEEAIGCYRNAITAYPEDATNHNNLGICLEKLNKGMEALEYYRQAVKLSPKNTTFQLNLANCLISLRCFEEVLDVVDTILAHEPKNHQAWGLRGELLAEQGKMNEAAKCYGRALGLAG